MIRLRIDHSTSILKNNEVLLSMASSLTGSSYQNHTPHAILDQAIQAANERNKQPDNLLAGLLQAQYAGDGITMSIDQIKWEHEKLPIAREIHHELKSLFGTQEYLPEHLPSLRAIIFVYSFAEEKRDMTIDFFMDNYSHSGEDKTCLEVQFILYSCPHSPLLYKKVPPFDQIQRLLDESRGDVTIAIENIVIGKLYSLSQLCS